MKNPVKKFIQHFTGRHPVRLHMTLILLAVTLSGVLSGKILYFSGMHSMGMRYLLSVCFAYFIMLGFVRIWLWYVSPKRKSSNFEMPDFSSGGGSSNSGEIFKGGGGKFGGGGSTASFSGGKPGMAPSASSYANPPVQTNLNPALASSSDSGSSGNVSSSKGSWSFSLDGLDEGILIILLGLVVAAIAGAWIYLIVQAPVILGEAAFEFGLGGGLYRRVRNMHGNWAGSIFKATVIPALIVFVLAGIFGFAADEICPGRHKLVPVVKECILEI